MKYRVVLTKNAQNRILEIHKFIVETYADRLAADKVLNYIIKEANSLADFPRFKKVTLTVAGKEYRFSTAKSIL